MSAESQILSALSGYTEAVYESVEDTLEGQGFNGYSAAVLQNVPAIVPGAQAAASATKTIAATVDSTYGTGSTTTVGSAAKSVGAAIAPAAVNIALSIVGLGSLANSALIKSAENGLENAIKSIGGRTFNSDQYAGARYYYYCVLGQNISAGNVTDAMCLPALKWFIQKFGVFISGAEHIDALIDGGSNAYLAEYKVNTDTTTDTDRVNAAASIAQAYFNTGKALGSWSQSVGVYDVALVQEYESLTSGSISTDDIYLIIAAIVVVIIIIIVLRK